MLLVCWCVLSGMGVTDAPNDNATYHCSDSALLNHPYLLPVEVRRLLYVEFGLAFIFRF